MATVPILDTMINEYQSFNEAHQGAVNNASQIPKHRFQKEVEIVERIKHTLQKDTNSFGVYCCFFASQVLSNKCKEVPADIHAAKNTPEYGFL